jgi:hypothetical protein
MTQEFRAHLRTKLAPFLRASGFSGSGVTFRRVRGEVIQLLHVQGSRTGESCCVELCVHLTFLPTVLGRATDPKKITFGDCEFRNRLVPRGESDWWWEYGRDRDSTARSADDLTAVIRRVALPHFDRFGIFPGAFEEITPQAIAAGDLSVLPGPLTVPRAALTMARIAAHLGQSERAREFAEVGLASITGSRTISGELALLAGRS